MTANTEVLRPAANNIRVYPDGRLRVNDACLYTGLSYKTLATHRSNGTGPAFVKLGRDIFYLKNDLDEWLKSCRIRSVNEYRARNKRV